MFRKFFILPFLLLSCSKENVEIIPFKFTAIETPVELARASAFCFTIGNKGFVGCGRNNDSTLSDFWEFNPDSSRWIKKSNFIGIARVSAVATVLNGKAYVGLGYSPQIGWLESQCYLKDFYEYSPETDKWKSLADFPSKQSDACIAFSCNNKVFVATGFDSESFGNCTWLYDPLSNTWKEVGQMDVARANAICVDNGRIFAGLGYNSNLNVTDWYEFDTINYNWNARKSMPDNGRLVAMNFIINGKVFVAGGRHWGGDCDPRADITSIYQYNASNDSWSKSGNNKNFARERAISFSFNNEAYFGLGENDLGLLSDFWKIELE
jgi:N-acetylneuraminic acid mutarotase